MAVAKVVPKAKRSPAQVAAGNAFAAAGRASQAATRAAVIKKTGKPPARKKAPKKKVAAVAPEPLLLAPGSGWPTGCNDTDPTCAAVAVACHLQAATGFTLTDEEILKLHKLAGGGAPSGVRISDVLEAMTGQGWRAWSPCGRFRLLSFFQTDEQLLVAGLVVGVTLGHEGHAVLSAPGGMISWGQYLPWDGEPEEAWALEWGS
jgi:hypothetical protein